MEHVSTYSLDPGFVMVGTLSSKFREMLDAGQYNLVCILVDENTQHFCLPVFGRALGDLRSRVFCIRPGEQSKSLDTCLQVWQQLSDAGADRKSVLINLGGGVVTDLGGFVASTYMRGMDFFHVPTTVMGMADAAIGGKTGINLNTLKNYIGTFSQPRAVWVDAVFLDTLPQALKLEGLAEILKHALIRDPGLFESLEACERPEALPWLDLLDRSVQIKVSIVKRDPGESGLRKLLNFGHTAGHALESLTIDSPRPIKHGFAVAIGMWLEAFVSVKLGLLDNHAFARIDHCIRHWFPPVPLAHLREEEIFHVLKKDKKKAGSQIGYTLLTGIGEGKIDQAVPDTLMLEAIRSYQTLGRQESVS